ncbi:MAG: endopeptidase La [Deltaproteobacteria bacterium]|nr:MAG: endopeptidase La [Deltaproteobacteria bacterium]
MGFFRKSQNEILETPDLEKLRKLIDSAGLPEYALAVAEKEIERLAKIDASMPEYPLGIAYLEYLASLPWNKYTDDNLDLDRAKQILDSYHYGLESVKERILEFLAVRTLCSMRPFSILVVDDEPVARTNLEYVLRKEGYEVVAAENGAEALEKLEVREFDLLLTDLKMDKVDGIELLKRAKKIVPSIEIVIFTGYATVSSAVEALQLGAAHYLTKPISLDELREVVKNIRGKKRHIQNVNGPILCFSGPPGTGKTSVGKAIAEALGRKFTRLSLAGMRDESELRGHRRTYVGAMPGRIINEIKRLGVRNPLFMLDEIDKMGQDFNGDPSSVLLEILDPEQNNNFLDYYLDLPFDLSPVIFIATANSVEDLSAPLRDRMEIITFSGYSEKEKLHIARSHLMPKQVAGSGLMPDSPQFKEDAIIKIIREYTEESGVRNLEREIATICRKLARERLRGSAGDRPALVVGPAEVEKLLGPRKYQRETKYASDRVGVATGLVWTDFGGEIIFVETSIMPGAQQLILTGSLGTVIKESAQTALSYIRSHAGQLGIDSDFYADKDIHIHIPAGDIPKDGPSAGLTIAIALISLLTGRKARSDVAITGELSLTGRILPVKGVKEKILAAQRAGINTVIFPKENAKDIETLGDEVLEGIQVITAEELLELTDVALMPLERKR